MTRPLRTDIEARVARERAGLCECDACKMHTELYRVGYVLFPLADPSEIKARPVKMKARQEGSCVTCCQPIAVGDAIWWTRGRSGVDCADCGGRA